MAHCDEWTDWHLTNTGWVKGNTKTTFTDVEQVDVPVERVLTKRYRELQTSSFSKNKFTTEIEWSCGDAAKIDSLLAKFPFLNSL